MTRRRRRGPELGNLAAAFLARALVALAFAALVPTTPHGQGWRARGDAALADSARQQDQTGLIPAGFGSLRGDEVSVVVQVLGLTVKAMPLEESVIRTLAPDRYRAFNALRESKAAAIDSIRRRLGRQSVQTWYVQYFNAQQGEARFDPHDVLIRSAGRDFRPFAVLPLVGRRLDQGRLPQRENADGVYVFDPAIELTQPLTVAIAGQSSAAWGDILQKLERERAAIWSRAAAARRAPLRQPRATRSPWR